MIIFNASTPKAYKAQLRGALRSALNRWVEMDLDRMDREWKMFRTTERPKKYEKACKSIVNRMAGKARPFLDALTRDNSHLTAEELHDIAGHLSPGGAHTGGLLAQIIDVHLGLYVDDLLMAAIYRYNWHGGKGGFQFLPDPVGMDPEEYETKARSLVEFLDRATDSDPRRILTGEDLAFYDSLPNTFTIYRGTKGISADVAGMGVCWTTQREVAEWFASKWCDADSPVVIAARCRKVDVVLVKANEFEIVTQPSRFRQIVCRPHKKGWRPEMEWNEAA